MRKATRMPPPRSPRPGLAWRPEQEDMQLLRPAERERLRAHIREFESMIGPDRAVAVWREMESESGFRRHVLKLDRYGDLRPGELGPLKAEGARKDLEDVEAFVREVKAFLEAEYPHCHRLVVGPEEFIEDVIVRRAVSAWGRHAPILRLCEHLRRIDHEGAAAMAELRTALMGLETLEGSTSPRLEPLGGAIQQLEQVADAVRSRLDIIAAAQATPYRPKSDRPSKRALALKTLESGVLRCVAPARTNEVPLDFLVRVMQAADPTGVTFRKRVGYDQAPTAAERFLALVRFWTWGLRRKNDHLGAGDPPREEAWARAYFAHRDNLRLLHAKPAP